MKAAPDRDRALIDALRRMAIFAKVVEAGSLRAAARRLGLSTSVISHHLSGLEEDVGAVLLERTTRRITLTREGAVMLDAAKNMLQAARTGMGSLRADHATLGGELRVTLPTVLSRAPFLKSIKSLEETFPHLTLSLRFKDGFSGLIDPGSDVVFFCGVPEGAPGTSRKVADLERAIVASDAYMQRSGSLNALDEVLEANWIWPRYEPLILQYSATTTAQRTKRAKITARTLVDDAMVCRRLALEGVGLTIMPHFVVADDIALGRLVPVVPGLHLKSDPLWVTAVEDPAKTALVEFFITFVMDSLQSV
ncbi:MAG: LysR family transcriptional regulator [Pseudomonadota bacterium]